MVVRGDGGWVVDQSVELDRGDSASAAGLRQQVDVVVRVARRLAPAADVEDVAQEAMLAAWRYRNSFDPSRAPLRAWLLAIVVRESRKARARSLRPTSGALPAQPRCLSFGSR